MATRHILLVLAMSLSVCAHAQLKTQGPPTSFSGAVVNYSDDSVTLRDGDGTEVVVQMTPGWFVSRPKPIDVSTVAAGDFIASRNLPVSEGVGRSEELRVVEPDYRPEFGTHMMAGANTAMTHGTVSTVTPTADGIELTIEYPGGMRTLMVAGDIELTGYDVLDRSVLDSQPVVRAVAREEADGVLRAGRLLLPALTE